MATKLPTLTIHLSVTRFVTRTSVLNIVKQKFPDAYIDGNQIIIPTLPDDYQEGDAYAIRIFTTPSYVEE